MPKVNKLQASFNSGEISKLVEGRTDSERYDAAMALCQNYIPTVQGPLLRRPGTKYVNNVKDPSKMPALIPFQFSATQNYMLEFGERYVRFYTNEGQILTSSNSFSIAGFYGPPGGQAIFPFTAVRPSPVVGPGEAIITSSVIAAGAILELATPYLASDVNGIKVSQKQDTLYLSHPAYSLSKLQRVGLNLWDLKQVMLQDGPYLPLNSYKTVGDSTRVSLNPTAPKIMTVSTGSSTVISNAVTAGSSVGVTITTATAHGFSNGDKVFVQGVFGSTELNNVTSGNLVAGFSVTNSTANQAAWTVTNVTPTAMDLSGAVLSNAYVGSGLISPALFQLIQGSSYSYWNDVQLGTGISGTTQVVTRTIGLINNGTRYWGHINQVFDAAHAQVYLGPDQSLPNTSTITTWQLGVYNKMSGYPAASCFHQDRLILAGCPGLPQEIDGSMSGSYEVFSASGSSLQVNNNNALQFGLNSQDLNAIRWVKSNTQGLLAGTQSAEWAITPSTQSPALYPTNIKADQVTFFGSCDADAVQAGTAALYIQRAQRKIRELLYFWQAGNFRSTDLSELSDHLSLPSLVKLAVQKEVLPIVWGLRSDGNLLSMSYSRDDEKLRAGWARHQLGGASDSAGTAPIVKSMAVIPSGDGSFDELWITAKRFINGTSVGTVEYMTKPFDDSTPQERAYHFDCGATYDAPLLVSNITNAPSCVFTSTAHGLTNSSTVRVYTTVGLNQTTIDINGLSTTANQFNGHTYMVASSSVNAFKLQDFQGNDINTNSSSIYVGSCVVRKLITNISGLTWLAGEQVSILADGGIHVNTSVTQAGALHLSYPAAVVQIGYQYNSDGQLLRSKDGSAQGTSIGATRRVSRVSFMLHNVGDLSFGATFTSLIPAQFEIADADFADQAPKLFDGILRDGVESSYGFSDKICFRQSSGLPGMIQSITRFLEEQDV